MDAKLAKLRERVEQNLWTKDTGAFSQILEKYRSPVKERNLRSKPSEKISTTQTVFPSTLPKYWKLYIYIYIHSEKERKKLKGFVS